LSQATTVNVTVVATTADNTATTADNDYVAKQLTITFTPGQTLQVFTVDVNGDANVELDETFFYPGQQQREHSGFTRYWHHSR